MSLSTIAHAAVDPQLNDRVQAAATREALNNPEFGDTYFGQQVMQGFATFTPLYWSVANDTEAAYETALLAGRGCPGFDKDIITDAQITAAVQAHWPPDPVPLTPPVTPLVVSATLSAEPTPPIPPVAPTDTTIVVDVEPEERNS